MPRGTPATTQDQEEYTEDDLANFDFTIPESNQTYPPQAYGQGYDPSSHQAYQPGYSAAAPASEH